MTLRQHIDSMYKKAIEAVNPSNLLRNNLVKSDDALVICGTEYNIKDKKIKIIAVGKAAASMTLSSEEILGESLHSGICITKYGHQLPLSKTVLFESAHPIPDENSVTAAQELLKYASTCTESDLVIVLISGGASSLLVDLPEGVLLVEMQYLYHELVQSGADINEINCVRKQLSSLKGGGLLGKLSPADVVTMAISDVIGDDPSTIASGLTFPNTTTIYDAIDTIKKYQLWDKLPESICSYLVSKTKKIGVKNTEKQATFHIIGNNHMSLDAAKSEASKLGYKTEIVGESFNGDIDELKESVIYKILSYNDVRPFCFLWGGEPTVNVTGKGKGGRNQHLVLMVCNILNKWKVEIEFIMAAIGTDGSDGPTDAAGAFMSNATLEKLTVSKQDITHYINDFDAYHFFESIDGLIKTGPTQTNVMDIVIVLLKPR